MDETKFTGGSSQGYFRELGNNLHQLGLETGADPSAERYRCLVENIDLGVTFIDKDHIIVMTNTAQANMFNKPAHEFIGKPCYQEFEKRDRICSHCPGVQAMAQRLPQEVETEGVRDDGSRFKVRIRAFPFFENGGEKPIGFIEVVQDVTEQKATEEKIRQSYQIQTVINSILQISLGDVSLKEILRQTLDSILAIPWLSFDAKGAIFLVEDEDEVLVMQVQNGLTDVVRRKCAQLPFGRCLCGKAAARQEVQFTNQLNEAHEVTYPGMRPHGHYCIPIVLGGRTMGVLNIYLRENHSRNQNEENFLKAVANTLAGIVQRKKAEKELQKSMQKLRQNLAGTIQAIALTVEARDPYTAGHQRRVADLARAIATEMGLSQDQIDGIRMAGVIHDIGKISIPAEILSRPGKLSELEFELIKTHAQKGYDILKEIEFPWPVAHIVRQHHERLDGSGYPQGLAGDDILLEAKIIGLADVVEAVASHRPYRSSRGIATALQEITSLRGCAYDPAVVDSCIRLFEEKKYTFDHFEHGRQGR